MELLILVCLVALVAAAPSPKIASASNPIQDVQLLGYENNNDGKGNYNYKFEQSDGTKQLQQGRVKNAGAENQSIVINGYYSWVAPNGVLYIVIYGADENGFQPEIKSGLHQIRPAPDRVKSIGRAGTLSCALLCSLIGG